MFFSYAFALLFAQSSSAALPPPESIVSKPEDEIIVTARRLRDFRAVVKTRRRTGEPYCKLRKSSGDAAFDADFCAAMVGCHVSVSKSPALRTVRDAKGGRKDLERALNAELERCMAPFFAKNGLDRK